MTMSGNIIRWAQESSSLHHAVSWGLLDEISSLIDQGHKVDIQGANGITPLHLAAAFGKEEVVRVLLERDADLNQPDNDGWTSLHWAAANAQTVVFEILQAHPDADLSLRDAQGFTPLHNIVIRGLFSCCGSSDSYVDFICEGHDFDEEVIVPVLSNRLASPL